VACAVVLCAVGACKKQDMYTQRVIRQWDSDPASADGSSVRPPVAGTLALQLPDAPVSPPRVITAALLARGQARFDIYCAPCHGASGNGLGMIVQRGFPQPPDLAGENLRHAPVQVFYDTITNGHGAMYSYAARVAPADRWAIAAYIRALQMSQASVLASLPATDRAALGDTP